MKVSELIAFLEQCDPDREVILQKDGEGNGYSPLSGFVECAYHPYNDWSGEARLESLTPELIAEGYSDEDLAYEDDWPVVILFPVN